MRRIYRHKKPPLGARYIYTEHKPSYEVSDLFGSYLAFGVDNVLNKYYVDALSLTEDSRVLPAPGRPIRVNFTSRFGDGDRSAKPSIDEREAIASAMNLSQPLLGEFSGDWSGFYVRGNWGRAHYSAEGNGTAGAFIMSLT